MKIKHIAALIVALAFIGVAAFALVDNKIDYSDFQKAATNGRRAQVSGTFVKEKGAHYDPATNTFTFTMKDHQGHEMPVKYAGARPNNFEIAPSVVCVGKVDGGIFEASDIQTKCPSRYEATGKMTPQTSTGGASATGSSNDGSSHDGYSDNGSVTTKS